MSLERGRYYAVLGALVVRERKKIGLTQTKLGERLGISQTTVARIEAGKLSVPVTLFNVIASELFGVTHGTLDKRIHKYSDIADDALKAVSTTWIPSRDSDRNLIDYVVAVKA